MSDIKFEEDEGRNRQDNKRSNAEKVQNIDNVEKVVNVGNIKDVEKIILTGDRPTGKLHLGHYSGSLLGRLRLQKENKVFILIADMQAMSCYFDNPKHLKDFKLELLRDYYAVGLDSSMIFLQSAIPAISVLNSIFMNLITLNKVLHNPTLKTEMQEKGNVSLGFIAHPIAQAADILVLKANMVPVGDDQLPLIELANDIGQKFNSIYQSGFFPEVAAITPKVGGRLSGIYGKQKASKSLNNAIFLSDELSVVREKVFKMYTDPDHILKSDPGKIEGNVVFEYLSVFGSNMNKVNDLKDHYKRGGLGDMEVKRYLFQELEKLLVPILDKRKSLNDNDLLHDLYENNKKVNLLANNVLDQVERLVF